MHFDIIGIGDSLTYGYPWDPSRVWLTQLGDILGLEVLNAGRNGDTTEGMRRRFSLVLKEKPKKVFIMGGINDFFQGISAENAANNLFAMARAAKEEGIEPILGIPHALYLGGESFFDPGGQRKAIDAKILALRNYILDAGYAYVDFFHALEKEKEKEKQDPGIYFVDEVHLSFEGNMLYAKTAIASHTFV